MEGLILFAIALVLLFMGYYVAFTFAGVSVLVGVFVLGIDPVSYTHLTLPTIYSV